MTSKRSLGPILGFVLEIVLWAGIAGAFLYAYLGYGVAGAAAIAPHLGLVASLLLGLWCLRLLLWTLLGRGTAGRIAATAVTTLLLVVALIYYALVLVGLYSWGRVISWALIKTYTLQAGDLIRSIGMSPWVVAGQVSLLFAVVFAAVYFMPARLRWTGALAARLSVGAALLCAVLGLALVPLRLYLYADALPRRVGEPVALTFLPEEPLRVAQARKTHGAQTLNDAEDAARRAYVPAPDAARRNVIVIVSDALRDDHLGVYGYARDTTPYLSELAREGRLVRAGRMYSACAESSCGLLAIARSKFVFQQAPGAFTLQEVLRRYGYRLHMILGGDHTNFYGLRAAYGEVDSYYDGSAATGYYFNDDQFVIDHLDTFPEWNAQPTFLQFHLMSTHVVGRQHEAALRYRPASSYLPLVRDKGVDGLDANDLAGIANNYDNGVVQFDEMVRQILERLERKGYLSDAVVVITGDHGEMLGEHHEFGHAKRIFERAVRVPFMLLRYGYAAGAPLDTTIVASQVDIAPTLLAELNMPAPPTWAGLALQKPAKRDFLFMQQGANVGLLDLREAPPRMKYWKNIRSGEEFVFDVVADPDERDNLLATTPPALLSQWRGALVPAAAGATP